MSIRNRLSPLSAVFMTRMSLREIDIYTKQQIVPVLKTASEYQLPVDVAEKLKVLMADGPNGMMEHAKEINLIMGPIIDNLKRPALDIPYDLRWQLALLPKEEHTHALQIINGTLSEFAEAVHEMIHAKMIKHVMPPIPQEVAPIFSTFGPTGGIKIGEA